MKKINLLFQLVTFLRVIGGASGLAAEALSLYAVSPVSRTRKHKCFIPLMFLIAVIFVRQAGAQGVAEKTLSANDSVFSLQAENIKTHKRLFFAVGQTVHYKLRSFRKFEKGLITGIADSTVSFQNKQALPVKSLCALRIRRSTGRRVTGASLMTLGTMTLIPAVALVSYPADESEPYLAYHALGILGGMVGLVEIGIGSELLIGQEIDLEKSWKLTPHNNMIH